MAQNATAQTTLRIVPHPDRDQRTFLTTEPRYNDAGVLVRPTGTRMFRYLVTGTPDEIAKYKIARGQYYIEDTDPTSPYFGTPLYNSQDMYERPMRLVFTRRGTVAIAADEETIRLEQSLKRANKFGAGVTAHVEQMVAQMIMADIQRKPVTTETVAPQPQANNLASLIQNGIPQDETMAPHYTNDSEEETAKDLDQD